MSFTIHIPGGAAFRAYLVDLSERVGFTFIESALAGITLGQATGASFWETAGITALFALGKGVLAYFVPALGNLKTAGALSWIISAIVKAPRNAAIVTVTPPATVATDVQTDTTQVSPTVPNPAVDPPKVSGADE